MKIAVFWVVAPCSLVEVYQRFGGPCCLHHQGDESSEDSRLGFLCLNILYTVMQSNWVSERSIRSRSTSVDKDLALPLASFLLVATIGINRELF
jgi:hypothetical protein